MQTAFTEAVCILFIRGLFHAEGFGGAAVYQQKRAGDIQDRESQNSQREPSAARLDLDLQAEESQHIHGGVDEGEKGVFGLQAFGIRLKDVIKAEVVRGEQEREQ